MLTSDVVLRHDSARPHTIVRIPTLLDHFSWELFGHPPYCPDLAPSNYYLCTYLKNWLGSQRFNNNELMKSVKMWLSSQTADFFHMGIQKLFPRYDKCPNSGRDYVDK
jgi:transposase